MCADISILYKPHDVQKAFHDCKDRFRAIIGGIGCGKTKAGVQEAIRTAIQNPGSYGAIIAPTYRMLMDATQREFLDVCHEYPALLKEYRKADGEAVMVSDSVVLFRSADNPERLRGPNLGWFYLDEGSLMSDDSWKIMIGRLRVEPGRGWVTTTPKGRNWLYQRQSEMTVFKAATKDNPHLPTDFIESLERSYTGNFARQELYGEFVAFEGLVYPMFDRSIHVKEQKPESYITRILANDEGYTNPAVIHDIGVDKDGRIHLFREWYRRGQLQDTVISANLDWWKSIKYDIVVVDSSAAGLIAAMRMAGLPSHSHKSVADATGIPAVKAGIARIQNRLAIAGDGRPRLTIDPSCVQTIAEFESYCWKEGKDEPDKQNDHAMDALRYGVDYIDGGFDPSKLVDWA